MHDPTVRRPLTVVAVRTWIVVVGAWLAFGGAPLLAAEAVPNQVTPEEVKTLEADLPDVLAVSRAFRTVSRMARPGVVHIKVTGGEDQDIDEDEIEALRKRLEELGVPKSQLERMLEQARRPPPGSGSGFIFDADGYVLTNNHVVADRESITVVLDDDRELEATLVGTDPKTDLAVLKIEARDLKPLRFGDSGALEVGDWVIAVGAPFGLTQTVTHGIVSAMGRTRVPGVDIDYQDFIQTDAAINPGNSGGPLLNLKGEVVGINTAIATQGEGVNAGVAFTIPSNLAIKIVRQLKATGSVQRGWLGVSFTPVTASDVELFGLPGTQGVLVQLVLHDSPAGVAGLEVEDVILSVDDTAVTGYEQARGLIAELAPEQKVRLRIIRDGQERALTVRLGLQPKDVRVSRRANATEWRLISRLGLRVRTLRPDAPFALQAYGREARGVEIVGLDEERTDLPELRAGELLVAVNEQPVASVRQLNEVLRTLPKSRKLQLEILQRDGDRRLVTIKPAE